MKRWAKAAAAVMVMGLLGGAAAAQPGGGGGFGGGRGGAGGLGALLGQPLAPEAAAKAWEAQASFVGRTVLNLDEKPLGVLKEAYAKTRTEHREELLAMVEEVRAAAQNGDFGAVQGAGQKLTELNTKHREALKGRVLPMVQGEAGEKALKMLGSFSGPWDQMVNSALGMSLEAEKLDGVMAATGTFAERTASLAQGLLGNLGAGGGAGGGGGGGGGAQLQEARTSLEESLKAILSEEQVETLMSSLRGGGRARPGRQGGEGAGDGARVGRGPRRPPVA